MSESLNVIALISGGKDSFYSILHCIQNGHKVVALGNVYPQPRNPYLSSEGHSAGKGEEDEEDLNSYMYQTVGHSVIPLYEQATGIPLYRQPILGDATAMGATYEKPESGIDETESLIPLLQRVMAAHPEANAVCTGAILSTYQRTRAESVALRLGLIPLSFLWKYPLLPPERQVSLLMDMASAGLDARIIKVASWGLDETFLWQNVASGEVMQKIERAIARFGTDEDGAALGEGGEFETLVLDGPDHLFKGRIVVDEKDRQVIRGSADTAWLRLHQARVEMKSLSREVYRAPIRLPDLLSQGFLGISQALEALVEIEDAPSREHHISEKTWGRYSVRISLRSTMEGQKWMVVGNMQSGSTIEEEVGQIIAQMKVSFERQGIDVGKIYGKFFTKPNPPARVTIACGDVLPLNCNVVVQLSLSNWQGQRRSTDDLHVQSRSYWAPANIGPYSQARSDVLEGRTSSTGFVHVAGQIPLVPSTMSLLEIGNQLSFDGDVVADLSSLSLTMTSPRSSTFIKETVLSLQHLWRVGQAMDVSYWTGAVAYLSKDICSTVHRKALLAARAWLKVNSGVQHGKTNNESGHSSEEDEPDLWEARYHMSSVPKRSSKSTSPKLPDWSTVQSETQTVGQNNVIFSKQMPPFFAAEVEELPRGSEIEWHAFLGITHGLIKQYISISHEVGAAFKHVVVNKFSQTFIFIAYMQEIQDIGATIDILLTGVETPEEVDQRRTSPGYYHSHSAYLDASIAGLWETDDYAGVVPCRSLWGEEGQRLAAVLIFQSFLEL